MALGEKELDYLSKNHSAAMITVGDNGFAKAVRVGVVLVDGRLWSSGTRSRARTARLRKDPRCTLYVHDATFGHLVLETTVEIIDSPDVPEQSVRLFRTMQGKPSGTLSWFGGDLDEDAFRARMVEEGRLIYEFTVRRHYGLY